MNTTTVEFPGLGIDQFTMNRIAFEVFGKPVYWYGVIIMLGMVAAFIHAYLRCKREGISVDDLMDVGIWTIVAGVLGARLYYVLTTLDEGNYHSFRDVIAIWEGGLAIYGGVLGAIIGVAVYCFFKKIKLPALLDLVALGFLLQLPKPSRQSLYQKEGFALTALVWIVMALFGALRKARLCRQQWTQHSTSRLNASDTALRTATRSQRASAPRTSKHGAATLWIHPRPKRSKPINLRLLSLLTWTYSKPHTATAM